MSTRCRQPAATYLRSTISCEPSKCLLIDLVEIKRMINTNYSPILVYYKFSIFYATVLLLSSSQGVFEGLGLDGECGGRRPRGREDRVDVLASHAARLAVLHGGRQEPRREETRMRLDFFLRRQLL